MIRKIFFQFLLLVSLVSHASPWFNFDDYEIESIYAGLQKYCNITNYRYSTSPNSLWVLEDIKNNLKNSNVSEDCNYFVEKLEDKLLKSFSTNINRRSV